MERRLRADIVANATVGKVSIFVFPFSGGDDGTGTRNQQPRLKLCAGVRGIRNLFYKFCRPEITDLKLDETRRNKENI